MSKFRELVEEVKMEQACGEDILDEGFGSIARNALLGAGIALGGMQGADAKTDPELLGRGASEITARFEHGGKGYKAIVKDNYGGYSYGNEQISTNRANKVNKPCSTFDFFLKYAGQKAPYIKKKLDAAGGWAGAFKATPEFRKAWLQLADQKEFQDVYDDFMLEKQVLPVFNRMDQATSVNLDKITTWGSKNSAVQAAIRSCIVQHGQGGAFDLICDVVKRHNPANMGEFIKDLYKRRMAKYPGHITRYKNELAKVIEYLKSNDSNIDMAYGHKPGQSGYELDQLINQIASKPVTPEKVSVASTPAAKKPATTKKK